MRCLGTSARGTLSGGNTLPLGLGIPQIIGARRNAISIVVRAFQQGDDVDRNRERIDSIDTGGPRR